MLLVRCEMVVCRSSTYCTIAVLEEHAHNHHNTNNNTTYDSIQTNPNQNNMVLSASTIILEYVCPGLGVLICQFMFSAPYRDLQDAVRRGEMGDLNPTPWAFMLGNCFGWVTYGILTQNLFIFWANAPGFLLSVYLNLGAVKLLYQRHHATEMRKSFVAFLQEEEETKQEQSKRDLEVESTTSMRIRISEPPMHMASTAATTAATTTAKDWATIVWNVTSQTTPAPAPHETLVLCIVTIWTICISILGFTLTSFTSITRQILVGSLVNLNLVFFYGAPLSTIVTVMTQKHSASIHIRTMVTNTLNGTFWMAYGLAVLDPFVYVPNGLGALLGVIQVLLIVWYPRNAAAAAAVASSAAVDEITEEMAPLPLTTTIPLDKSDVVLSDDEEGGMPNASSTDGSSAATLPLEP